MGMESPDTRRKADDSYRARSAGRSMCAAGIVALTEGEPMTELSPSLSIALWLVGSIWLIAILATIFGVPYKIVHAALAIGLLGGGLEWLAFKGGKR